MLFFCMGNCSLGTKYGSLFNFHVPIVLQIFSNWSDKISTSRISEVLNFSINIPGKSMISQILCFYITPGNSCFAFYSRNKCYKAEILDFIYNPQTNMCTEFQPFEIFLRVK